jgi:hypothetical protein
MGHSSGRLHASRTERLVPRAEVVVRPAHEEIARLAYSYWEQSGRQSGSAHEDWLRAERELFRKGLS